VDKMNFVALGELAFEAAELLRDVLNLHWPTIVDLMDVNGPDLVTPTDTISLSLYGDITSTFGFIEASKICGYEEFIVESQYYIETTRYVANRPVRVSDLLYALPDGGSFAACVFRRDLCGVRFICLATKYIAEASRSDAVFQMLGDYIREADIPSGSFKPPARASGMTLLEVRLSRRWLFATYSYMIGGNYQRCALGKYCALPMGVLSRPPRPGTAETDFRRRARQLEVEEGLHFHTQRTIAADSRDKYGRTPLLWAAEDGDEEVVKLLVERKDVAADSKDKHGRMPLLKASEDEHEAVVKLLGSKYPLDH
jgi:hypothetical protein